LVAWQNLRYIVYREYYKEVYFVDRPPPWDPWSWPYHSADDNRLRGRVADARRRLRACVTDTRARAREATQLRLEAEAGDVALLTEWRATEMAWDEELKRVVFEEAELQRQLQLGTSEVIGVLDKARQQQRVVGRMQELLDHWKGHMARVVDQHAQWAQGLPDLQEYWRQVRRAQFQEELRLEQEMWLEEERRREEEQRREERERQQRERERWDEEARRLDAQERLRRDQQLHDEQQRTQQQLEASRPADPHAGPSAAPAQQVHPTPPTTTPRTVTPGAATPRTATPRTETPRTATPRTSTPQAALPTPPAKRPRPPPLDLGARLVFSLPSSALSSALPSPARPDSSSFNPTPPDKPEPAPEPEPEPEAAATDPPRALHFRLPVTDPNPGTPLRSATVGSSLAVTPVTNAPAPPSTPDARTAAGLTTPQLLAALVADATRVLEPLELEPEEEAVELLEIEPEEGIELLELEPLEEAALPLELEPDDAPALPFEFEFELEEPALPIELEPELADPAEPDGAEPMDLEPEPEVTLQTGVTTSATEATEAPLKLPAPLLSLAPSPLPTPPADSDYYTPGLPTPPPTQPAPPTSSAPPAPLSAPIPPPTLQWNEDLPFLTPEQWAGRSRLQQRVRALGEREASLSRRLAELQETERAIAARLADATARLSSPAQEERRAAQAEIGRIYSEQAALGAARKEFVRLRDETYADWA
jgi:hypothetical protein